MAKKLSAQTIAATAKSLQKASETLAADEEQALRMRVGIGLQPKDALAPKTTNALVAEKLAQIELQAFRAMGAKVYGIGAVASKSTVAARGPKDKIIKALKKR